MQKGGKGKEFENVGPILSRQKIEANYPEPGPTNSILDTGSIFDTGLIFENIPRSLWHPLRGAGGYIYIYIYKK